MLSDLAKWHANPLTVEDAKKLAREAYQQRVECILSKLMTNTCDYTINELLSDFWLEKDYFRTYNRLIKTTPDDCTCAQLEMVMGQLLMSKKLEPAMMFLDNGLHKLNPYMESQNYLALVRRHELLSAIKLSSTTYPPASLKELENEAMVIVKLKGKRSHSVVRSDPKDTLG